MPKFSLKSQLALDSCHPDLRMLFNTVINSFDCTVICGHRTEQQQRKAFEEKRSQLEWPSSNHNVYPSLAVDVIPYPIDWKDIPRINYFAGYVLGTAASLKAQGIISHKIRWGGDWDRDTQLKDNQFNDLVHFELVHLHDLT